MVRWSLAGGPAEGCDKIIVAAVVTVMRAGPDGAASGYRASSSVSPVRMRSARATGVTKILPSPTSPVLAPSTMRSMTDLHVLVLHHKLDLHLGEVFDGDFASPPLLGHAALDPVPAHLGQSHAAVLEILQSRLHDLEFLRADDRFDFLHGAFLLSVLSVVGFGRRAGQRGPVWMPNGSRAPVNSG